jgi:protein-S-isoprenylcysteine O-methyltransferase Ste14
VTPLLAKIAWWVGVLGWYVIRSPYQWRARQIPRGERLERILELTLLSISFCGLFVIPVIYVMTDQPRFADYMFRPAAAWLGVIVFALSLALFYRTHGDLGRFWSRTLEIRPSHRLVTTGVYSYVRHPMYSAFFLWALAQALLLPNWIAGPAGLAGFGTLFCFRIRREERMMEVAFGDAYRAYTARTQRLVPGLF